MVMVIPEPKSCSREVSNLSVAQNWLFY